MKMLPNAALLSMALFATFQGQTATYYVAPTGTNGASGTAANPFFLIQEAVDLCTASNDTIYLVEGTYWQHFMVADKANLYNASSDPFNKATLSGSGVPGLNQVEIMNSTNIHIAHLIFREHYMQDANCIYAHATADELFITDSEFFNIGWGEDPTADPESFTPIRQAHAILINGRTESGITDVYIGRNHFHDIVVGNSECITLTGNTTNFLIEDNTIEDITNIGIDIAGHFPWAFPETADEALNQARNGRIRRNVVRRCRRPSTGNEPAGIYVDGGANVIIDRNEVYQNGTGISVGCENVDKTASGITVANNIIYGNDKFGSVFGANAGQVVDAVMRNNTFFDNGIYFDNSGGIALQKSANCQVVDNIVYVSSEDYYGISAFGYAIDALSIGRNLVYSPAGETPRLYVFSPADGSTASQFNVPYANPQFTSLEPDALNFQITSGSPAANQGDPAFAILPEEVDFYGNPRAIGQVDIGAAESDFLSRVEARYAPECIIYPNPAVQSIFILSDCLVSSLRLLDAQGNEVREKTRPNSSHFLEQLDGLSVGVYIVELQCKEALLRRKVLIR